MFQSFVRDVENWKKYKITPVYDQTCIFIILYWHHKYSIWIIWKLGTAVTWNEPKDISFYQFV
jgi:hypothetical protein